jgi:hypothetical protein
LNYSCENNNINNILKNTSKLEFQIELIIDQRAEMRSEYDVDLLRVSSDNDRILRLVVNGIKLSDSRILLFYKLTVPRCLSRIYVLLNSFIYCPEPTIYM